MVTIVTDRFGPEYFIDREEVQGWLFLPANAAGITRELSDMLDAVLAEMQAAQNVATAAAVRRCFGYRYGFAPDIVDVPDAEVSSTARLYGAQGITLDSVIDREDADWDDFMPDGAEWTDEAERLFRIFAEAVVEHREACTDGDCECRWAVVDTLRRGTPLPFPVAGE